MLLNPESSFYDTYHRLQQRGRESVKDAKLIKSFGNKRFREKKPYFEIQIGKINCRKNMINRIHKSSRSLYKKSNNLI